MSAGRRPLGRTSRDRLLRLGTALVLACLLVALVSVLSGRTRTEAAGDRGTRLAALDYDTAQLYGALNGANASAATGFGADRTVSPTMMARYDSYVTSAYLRLNHARGLLDTDGPDTVAAESIGFQLPRYTSQVDTARALRGGATSQAQAQLDGAARLMASSILPSAEALQRDESAALAADYERAGGFPVVVVLVALLTVVGLVAVSVAEARRTKRVFNVGLVTAVVLVLATTVWWLVATLVAGGHLDDVRAHNTTATDLGGIRVVMLQARAAETAALADSAPNATAPTAGPQGVLAAAFDQVLRPGGALDAAGPGSATDAIRTAVTGWQQSLRDHGIGSDESRVSFVRVTTTVTDAVDLEQGQRTTAVSATASALTGLTVGPAVLAVLAAAATGLGVRARLREYQVPARDED